MRLMRLVFLLLVIASATLALPGTANANSYEAEIFSLVNGVRSAKLTSDSGLQAAARAHSRNMAQSGNLSHGGAASRIGNAAPAGYTGTYCENLGYASANQDVARTIYNGWRSSSGHNACMRDGRMTVAGVGTYFDSERNWWWVTMEFAQVRRSSSSNNPPPPTAPLSTPKPEVQATSRPQAAAAADKPEGTSKVTPSPTPKPTATPEPEESRNDVQAFSEQNTSVPPDEPMLGTREYASLGALLAFAGFVFFLARRRV